MTLKSQMKGQWTLCAAYYHIVIESLLCYLEPWSFCIQLLYAVGPSMQTLEEEYFRQQPLLLLETVILVLGISLCKCSCFFQIHPINPKYSREHQLSVFLGRLLNFTEEHYAFVLISVIKTSITYFFLQ